MAGAGKLMAGAGTLKAGAGTLKAGPGRSSRGRPWGTKRYGSARIIPPSTGTIAPVTNDAAGESRNAPTRPISATSP